MKFTADNIAIIINGILAFLTSAYVILTWRLVNESKKATDETRAMFEKQFLLSTLPYIHISIIRKNSKVIATVSNLANIAACDVDFLIIGIYDEGLIEIPVFDEKYIKEKSDKINLESDEDGLFGVYDHLWYPIFPQKRKVVAQIDFPEPPNSMHCLLQFRDISGTNYSQVQWFYLREDGRSKSYALGSAQPSVATLSPRIDYEYSDEKILFTEKNKKIPDYISREFEHFWKYSIPSGYTKAATYQVEDRGKWFDL